MSATLAALSAERSRLLDSASGSATAVIVLATAVILLVAARLGTASRDSPSTHKPIARPEGSLPILYDTVAMIRHQHDILTWVARQNELLGGRTWQLQISGDAPTVVVNTPELVEDILVTHFDNFGKGEYIAETLRDLLGEGIFAVDGLKWLHQRKTASNLFSNRDLREFMEVTVKQQMLVLTEILHRYADADATGTQRSIDVFSLMNKFTLEVFAEIGFSVKMGALTVEDAEGEGVAGGDSDSQSFESAFDGIQRLVLGRFMSPRWLWKTQRYLNIGSEKKLRSCIKVIDDAVYGIISQSIKNRQDANSGHTSESGSARAHKDIVSLFLDNVSNDAKPGAATDTEFDPKYLRDIVVNFLIAGRDTTAQALSWFFYCLSQNPRVEQKIRDELAAKLPELMAGEHSTPSMEQLHQLVYLEAAIKETLRLYPSVPDNTKQCLKDTLLCDGSFVKAGWYIAYPGYSLGRMEHIWGPDAKEYKPERWIDSDTGKLTAVSAFKFNAFHAGPRMCLGMNLAMMEMKTVASVLLSRFRFSLVPGQDITYDLSITLPIKGALMMTVTSNAPLAH